MMGAPFAVVPAYCMPFSVLSQCHWVEIVTRLLNQAADVGRSLYPRKARRARPNASDLADLAKSTAERIRHDTTMSSSALSEAARRRVRAQLAESAATMARDLIGRNFQPTDQGRLIDGFMDKLAPGDRQ